MAVSNFPDEETLAGLLKQVWRQRTPSAELRASAVHTALDAMRRGRGRKAIEHARRLAVMLYVSLLTLALMTVVSLASVVRATLSAPAQQLILIGLALVSIVGCVLAGVFASRWCRTMGLPRALRWIPLASAAGAFIVAAGLLNVPSDDLPTDAAATAGASRAAGAATSTAAPDLEASLDLVSRALTHTMTVSQSQAWLNAQLPANVERAWFVTPEGLVALSSITRVNEISRSVMDFIFIAQTLPATFTSAADVHYHAELAPGAPGIAAQAIVYSGTPLMLQVIVREAMRDLSTHSGSQVIAHMISHTDGTLAGIVALSVRPSSQPARGAPVAPALAGLCVISLAWASWVFMVERARHANGHANHHTHAGGWAAVTAVLLPVGLLIYLAMHNDD
jgi:hypothetical protein